MNQISKKFFSIHTILVQLLSVSAVAFFLNKYSLEDYGYLVKVTASLALLSTIFSFGFSVRFLDSLNRKIDTYCGSVLIIIVLLSIFILLFLIGFFEAIIFLNLSIVFFHGLSSLVLIFREKLFYAAVIPLVSQIFNLAAIYFSKNIEMYIVIWTILNFLLLLINFFVLKTVGAIFNRIQNSKPFNFSNIISSYLTSVLEIAHSRADIVVLGFILGLDEIAIFSIGKMILLSVSMILMNFFRAHTKELLQKTLISVIWPKIFISYIVVLTFSFLVIYFLSLIDTILSGTLVEVFSEIYTVFEEYGYICVLCGLIYSIGRSLNYVLIIRGQFLLSMNLLAIICILMLSQFYVLSFFTKSISFYLLTYSIFELIFVFGLLNTKIIRNIYIRLGFK